MEKVLSEKMDKPTDLENEMEIDNVVGESQILNNTNEKDTLESTNSIPDLSNDVIEIIELVKKEKLKPKTKVKITLSDGKIYKVNIHKSPSTICLADLKNNMPISGRFRYYVKTCDEDGDILFDEYDDNTAILPLFKDKIIVECKPVL